MGKEITLTIDDRTVTVPQGTLIVDAAKRLGIDIPVFCYHPKLEPVGMCRMCLVEIGRPLIDRATGEPQRNPDGTVQINFSPKLETACTTPVSMGMVVRTQSEKVLQSRKEVLEFLLTSHPLDCPICDKGGECPLQNLTMAHGPGQSRFLLDDKIHLDKHYPLGELIFLDRERCIQCGRCVRFQDEVVGEPVIAFAQRGRALQIVTHSDPGFDSVFSGNTTDICPVGALTTADFRFGARPWELNTAASICNHCPVGCNLSLNVRREDRSGGKFVIKRVMPRQNEAVNEIWICDKGRLGYHYTESAERLTQPLVRKNGELLPATWEEALERAAAGLKAARKPLVTLVGGRLPNEDLFNLYQLTAARNGQVVLDGSMAGGDLVSRMGLSAGSNLGELGKGSAILVVAADLYQEAPLWWLRIKQAAERGATLIVANPRATRLEAYAQHRLRYAYGEEAQTLAALLPGAKEASEALRAAGEAFAAAENAIVLYGSEGLGLEASAALSQTAAALLVRTQHVGRPNNGLVAVWPHGNTQGAWELGFRPVADLAATLAGAGAAYLAGVDPVGDDPSRAQALQQAGFVVVQELFLNETARLADVVLPVQAFTEREGSYTSGERRAQRFYPAIPPLAGTRPDFEITAEIAQRLGVSLEGRAASLVMARIAESVPAYAGLSYSRLAEVTPQWPIVGRKDLYYGGTGYDNHQGLGASLARVEPLPQQMELPDLAGLRLPAVAEGELLVLPVTRLYDQGALLQPSRLLAPRVAPKALWLNPQTAGQMGLDGGQSVAITLGGAAAAVAVQLDEEVPLGVALLPRSVGLAIHAPAVAKIGMPSPR